MATAEQVLVLFEFHNAFPVLQTEHQTQEYIPYNIIAPHEAQAMRNHGGQSLQRLAERGGLDWTEILAVLRDKTWREMGYGLHCSKEEVDQAKEAVLAYVRERRGPCGCQAISHPRGVNDGNA